MLFYHPMRATPVSLTALRTRLLGLFHTTPEFKKSNGTDCRLLDFVIAFPHTLKQIRLPSEYRSRKAALRHCSCTLPRFFQA